MEEGSLAVLVDAKTEYTHQFIHILKPNMYKCINNIFIKSKQDKFVFKKFQEELSLIPKWNQHLIDKEHSNILNLSGCDWLDELITAVFVSHTRILTSINMNKEKGKINLKIPKTSYFIHKCYIDLARHIWKNSYLFDDGVSNDDKQKNRRECENIIEKSIIETIRKEIPIKSILKEYLGNDYINNYNAHKETNNNNNNNKIQNSTEETHNKPNTVIQHVVDVEETEAKKKEESEAKKKEEETEAKKKEEEAETKKKEEEAEAKKKEEEAEAKKKEESEEKKKEEEVDILKIEELDLDNLKNLNDYKEIYLEEPIETKTLENKDIKTISITDKNNKKMTEVINLEGVVVNKENENNLNKYKEKSNYKFF